MSKIPVKIIRSTFKAHLVEDESGRQGWVTIKSLRNGHVLSRTFENAVSYYRMIIDSREEKKAENNKMYDLKFIAKETPKALALQVHWAEEITDQRGSSIIWLPKSKIKESSAPGWLLKAKIEELQQKMYRPGAHFEFTILGCDF